MSYYPRPDLFPVGETYALVRRLQPNCLICFKQGANGDEDFTAPEVVRRLRPARAQNCDLLMNTGPLPDGSIHAEDVKTLAHTGRLLRGVN